MTGQPQAQSVCHPKQKSHFSFFPKGPIQKEHRDKNKQEDRDRDRDKDTEIQRQGIPMDEFTGLRGLAASQAPVLITPDTLFLEHSKLRVNQGLE